MAMNKENLVILVFSTAAPLTFRAFSLFGDNKDFKSLDLKISFPNDAFSTYALESQKAKTSLNAAVGDVLDIALTSLHFREVNIPVGVFDKSDVRHLTAMTIGVQALMEKMLSVN